MTIYCFSLLQISSNKRELKHSGSGRLPRVSERRPIAFVPRCISVRVSFSDSATERMIHSSLLNVNVIRFCSGGELLQPCKHNRSVFWDNASGAAKVNIYLQAPGQTLTWLEWPGQGHSGHGRSALSYSLSLSLLLPLSLVYYLLS